MLLGGRGAASGVWRSCVAPPAAIHSHPSAPIRRGGVITTHCPPPPPIHPLPTPTDLGVHQLLSALLSSNGHMRPALPGEQGTPMAEEPGEPPSATPPRPRAVGPQLAAEPLCHWQLCMYPAAVSTLWRCFTTRMAGWLAGGRAGRPARPAPGLASKPGAGLESIADRNWVLPALAYPPGCRPRLEGVDAGLLGPVAPAPPALYVSLQAKPAAPHGTPLLAPAPPPSNLHLRVHLGMVVCSPAGGALSYPLLSFQAGLW